MPNQDKPLATKKDKGAGNTPVPLVGQPLDGRHYLDVVEEQEYTGKPFVKKEQNDALGLDEKKPAPDKSD